MATAVLAAAVVLLTSCSKSSNAPAAAPPTTVTSTTVAVTAPPGATTSTTVPIQTGGPRTVLSPIGLNLRAQASKTAPVVGTAAEGSTLTVLGHTDQGGGWYQVKGATVTGFITDNPALSAMGKFMAYNSAQHNFAALYPATWTVTEAPPASVVFHPSTGGDSIVVTTAATVGQLARGRSGYRQNTTSVVVVCGVTGDLVTYAQSGASTSPSTAPGGAVPQRYLVQVHLALDAQHALGLEANLGDLAQLQMVKDVVNSISFPFPQCEQGATPSDTSSTAPATTVH